MQKQTAMNLLNHKNDELNKTLERNKKLFMVVTHDLANPIMVLTTNIRLLKIKYNDDAFKEKFFQKASKMEKDIFNVIKSAKEMMAIEDGKLKVDLQPTNIHSILVEAKDIQKYAMKGLKKNINFLVK